MRGIKRGCGTRKTGGCYVETDIGENGVPMHLFYLDPPVEVDPESIKKVGVTLVEREGVWHILDWVGREHYATMPDFIEEMRRFGLSRRIPKTLDFSKLSSKSRIILLHPKALVKNPEVLKGTPCNCAYGVREHKNNEQSCFWNAWQALPPGERKMPSFTYTSNGVGEEGVEFAPAMFAAFPISRLVQVRDDSAVDAMSASGLNVEVAEE